MAAAASSAAGKAPMKFRIKPLVAKPGGRVARNRKLVPSPLPPLRSPAAPISVTDLIAGFEEDKDEFAKEDKAIEKIEDHLHTKMFKLERVSVCPAPPENRRPACCGGFAHSFWD